MNRRSVLLVMPLAVAGLTSRAWGQAQAQGQSQAQGQAQGQRIAEIQMAPPYLRMVPNAQTQASATAYDSLGTPLNVRFRWYSNNINVAVVDSTGMVRAVAPGSTLITALAEAERGRRRGGQMTVRVIAAAGAGGITVVPSVPAAPGGQPTIPPAAGAMPIPGNPNVWTVPPGMPRMTDSAMKASINCAEPFMNAANPMQACYDRRPRLRGPEPWSAMAACGGEHGMPLMLLVRVTETGQVTEVMPFTSGMPCPGFVDSATTAARAMVFEPAQRAGQPTAAWVRMIVRGGPMPPRGPENMPPRGPEARPSPQPPPAKP